MESAAFPLCRRSAAALVLASLPRGLAPTAKLSCHSVAVKRGNINACASRFPSDGGKQPNRYLDVSPLTSQTSAVPSLMPVTNRAASGENAKTLERSWPV